MQPAQQQGRRFPSISSVRVLSIRWLLVSAFLADTIQQIHSLRASGVISSHAARADGAEARVFRKSAGTLCTTPVAISFLVMGVFYQIHQKTNSLVVKIIAKIIHML
jgi:ABC-type sugar transport system permease subunit